MNEHSLSQNSIIAGGAVTLFAVVIGYKIIVARKSFVPREQLPPPAADLGLFQCLKLVLSGDGPQMCLKWAREVGYIFRLPGLERQNAQWVMIGDPKLGRQILEDTRGTKPWEIYLLFDKAAGGETFFGQNGPRALHVRKSTNVAFNPKNLQTHMAPIVNRVVQDWIETRLEPLYVQTGNPLDIDEEMMFVTTDIIAKAAFDYPLNKDERLEFTNTMRDTMEIFFLEGLDPIQRFFPWFCPQIRKAKRQSKKMQAFAKRMLQACRENENANKQSLMYMIVNDSGYKNDDERASDILLYFFAGYETTAHSIAWTMLELARNPKEQSNLRDALKEHKDGSIAQCPYVKHVTRETLRLHTPASLGPARMLDEDIVLPCEGEKSPMILPKGSILQVCLHVILHNHNIFNDADSFVPGRWEQPTDEMQKAFYPFALGRRNCQGMGLAQLELATVVSELTSKYRFEVAAQGEAQYMVTMRPKGSLLTVKVV